MLIIDYLVLGFTIQALQPFDVVWESVLKRSHERDRPLGGPQEEIDVP